MAVANSDWSELITTTLERRRRAIADNVLGHNALLARLKEQGNVDPAPGGRTLVEELRYAANSTFKWYADYEVLDLTPQQTHSAAEYAWKQAAITIMINGSEMAKNSGREQMIPLMRARTEGAESDLTDQLALAVYADGTASGGKELGGLQHLVAYDPTTGIVGGINRANFSFWQNKSTDINTDISSSANLPGRMRTMWLSLIRGSDKPNLIIADSNAYEAYWSSLTDNQRLMDPQKGVSGFQSLAFNGPGGQAPVLFDDRCPTDTMYFINTKYLKFRPHTERNPKVSDQIASLNQDAVVVHLLWMGNLTMSNASLQGVLHNNS